MNGTYNISTSESDKAKVFIGLLPSYQIYKKYFSNRQVIATIFFGGADKLSKCERNLNVQSNKSLNHVFTLLLVNKTIINIHDLWLFYYSIEYFIQNLLEVCCRLLMYFSFIQFTYYLSVKCC